MPLPIRAVALVLVFVLAAPGFAQAGDEPVAIADSAGGTVVTLEEALVATYRFNPQLEAERANLRGTDQRYAQALAAFRTLAVDRGALRPCT